jgi:uncharacterized delta-60 repeat protein
MRMTKALPYGIVVLILVVVLAASVPPLVSGGKPGSPDTSFHPPDGYVLFGDAAGGRDRGVEVAVQDDGKIVALGYGNNSINEDLLLVRYNADGSLDRDFGNGGVVLYDGGGNDRGLGLALQDDGKIVATGFTYAGSQRDVILLRYTANGTPDTAFGNGGVVTYSSPGSATDIGFGVAIRNDGGIVVAGETANVTGQDTIVLCYTATGSPDTRFGTGGVFTYGGAGMDRGFAAAIQGDGKIVVAGSTVANTKDDVLVFRLNPDGTTDTTFGENGAVTFSGAGDYPDYGNCVSVQPGGKIFVSGAESDGSTFDVLLLRYNPDGSPDTAFGMDGAAAYGSPGGRNDYGYAHVIQPDGRIVVTGFTQDGTNDNLLLLRFEPTGDPDTTFGSDGVVTWNGPGNNTDYGQGIALQSDGRIVITGFCNNGADEDLLIMRFIQ